MRPNINRYKQRTDYTRPLHRGHSTRTHSVDGVSGMKRVAVSVEKVQPAPQAPAAVHAPKPVAKKIEHAPDDNTLKMQFSVPSFRQPPGVNDAPSKQSLKWALFAVVGVAFFIFGYHNLWHLLHKPATALISGFI